MWKGEHRRRQRWNLGDHSENGTRRDVGEGGSCEDVDEEDAVGLEMDELVDCRRGMSGSRRKEEDERGAGGCENDKK